MKKLQGRLEFLAIRILGIDAAVARLPAALATGSLPITAYFALPTNVAGQLFQLRVCN
jgi:hypothetical protein